ncbi:MAG: NAD-dependent epimerase/dehydratase family protein [Kiritimatiellia bacterium]
MQVLVTGAAGFAGRHACQELAAHGYRVIGADRVLPDAELPAVASWVQLDITDPRACREVLAAHKPDACLHMAGIAFVPNADAAADRVFLINTVGTLHILDAALAECPKMRTLVVTTSEVYGDDGSGTGMPLREDTPLAPRNLYGISKAAADQCALLYARTRDLDVLTARPSNHTGPGQRPPFVVPAFIERLLALRACSGGKIKVGNLDSRRRFLDVRDVVRAYRLLLEKGRSGEAYNISTDVSLRIGAVLDLLVEKTGVAVETEIDPAFFRPTDATAALDLSKIKRDCGWGTAYDLSATLDAMLEEAGAIGKQRMKQDPLPGVL